MSKERGFRLQFKDWLLEAFPAPTERPALVRKHGQENAWLAGRWMQAIGDALGWIRDRILPKGSTAPIDPGESGVGHRRPPKDRPYAARMADPQHELGDRHFRTDSEVLPSERMGGLDTLWGANNHGLHTWMIGHGSWSMRNCMECITTGGRYMVPKHIGSGYYGHAFQVGDELVLKVTPDSSEAALSWKIAHANLDETMVIDVRKLRNYSLKASDVFAILQHMGQPGLPAGLIRASLLMKYFMSKYIERKPSNWDAPDLPNKVLHTPGFLVDKFAPEVSGTPDDETLTWIKFLINMINNIYNVSGAIWLDSHMRNIMMDKMGRPRAIDLGQWVVKEGSRPLTTRDIPAA